MCSRRVELSSFMFSTLARNLSRSSRASEYSVLSLGSVQRSTMVTPERVAAENVLTAWSIDCCSVAGVLALTAAPPLVDIV